jgi:hypothetical protein
MGDAEAKITFTPRISWEEPWNLEKAMGVLSGETPFVPMRLGPGFDMFWTWPGLAWSSAIATQQTSGNTGL